MPRKGPSKVPVYIAMTSLGCFAAGLWLSATPPTFATRLAATLLAGWQSIGIPMELPDAMFALGMGIALTLVASYFWGMRTYDPRGKTYIAR